MPLQFTKLYRSHYNFPTLGNMPFWTNSGPNCPHLLPLASSLFPAVRSCLMPPAPPPCCRVRCLMPPALLPAARPRAAHPRRPHPCHRAASRPSLSLRFHLLHCRARPRAAAAPQATGTALPSSTPVTSSPRPLGQRGP